jgi:hypothetical protein
VSVKPQIELVVILIERGGLMIEIDVVKRVAMLKSEAELIVLVTQQSHVIKTDILEIPLHVNVNVIQQKPVVELS